MDEEGEGEWREEEGRIGGRTGERGEWEGREPTIPVPKEILVHPEHLTSEIIQVQHHIQQIKHQHHKVQANSYNLPPPVATVLTKSIRLQILTYR